LAKYTKPDTSSAKTSGKKGTQKNNDGFFGKGALAITIVIGVVVLIAIYLVVNAPQPASGQGTVVEPRVCADKIISFVNENLVQLNSTASLVSVEEMKGMYVINTSYQEKTVSVYTTKDCTLLFMNPLPLETTDPIPVVT
jgi:hypothetical protein